ncbi:hypothetical protein ACFRCI_19040 [Streptomyces sp. NPDC056638]
MNRWTRMTRWSPETADNLHQVAAPETGHGRVRSSSGTRLVCPSQAAT